MPPPHRTTKDVTVTTLTVSDRNSTELKGDALVLVSVQTEAGATLAPGHGLPKATVAHLESALSTLKARGEADEVVKLVSVPGVTAPLVVVTGSGKAPKPSSDHDDRDDCDGLDPEAIRRAVGSATRQLGDLAKVGVIAPGKGASEAVAAAEGALFGAYTIKSGSAGPGSSPVRSLVILTAAARDKSLRAALALGAFGGHLTVGGGSSRGPRLVTLDYAPAKARKDQRHIAFVGKGITFDSGGLALKPVKSMTTMKCDMAGAAAVASAVFAIAELGLPVKVTAHLCLAENMVGPGACRPGDVIALRGGKTVELNNPDAEGRMVMADGLALASEQQPDLIIDIATLTGAAVAALGNRTAAFLSNDDTLRDAIKDIADAVGEPFWPFPLLEDIRPTLKSGVADLLQSGPVGIIYAGWFLAEFVGNGKNGQPIPWAHLDIAGPAFNNNAPWGYTPKQGTGFGIRTLVGIAESQA